MCAAVAAQREALLLAADVLEISADLNEHAGRAKVRARHPNVAAEGRQLLRSARHDRACIAWLLAAATDLTDYDEDRHVDPAWLARALTAASEFRRSHHEARPRAYGRAA